MEQPTGNRTSRFAILGIVGFLAMIIVIAIGVMVFFALKNGESSCSNIFQTIPNEDEDLSLESAEAKLIAEGCKGDNIMDNANCYSEKVPLTANRQCTGWKVKANVPAMPGGNAPQDAWLVGPKGSDDLRKPANLADCAYNCKIRTLQDLQSKDDKFKQVEACQHYQWDPSTQTCTLYRKGILSSPDQLEAAEGVVVGRVKNVALCNVL